MTITRTLDYGMGYAGKLGNKCYIARILGSDTRYGLRREFLEPAKVEREHFNRPRTIVHFSYELEASGLYELSEQGERWIIAALPQKDETAKLVRVSDARIKAWIAALDAGQTDNEARLASKGL